MKTGRVLLVGPIPPLYGGIASQIANIVSYLAQVGCEHVQSISWSKTDAVESDGGVVRKRIDINKLIGLLLKSSNWPLALRLSRALRAGENEGGHRENTAIPHGPMPNVSRRAS